MSAFFFQIDYFAKKYKVIAVDSRAQGKSVDTSSVLNYEMMADDFNALLDTLKIDSANVIGWSDGGIDGLLLAIRHPKKVKKLAEANSGETVVMTGVADHSAGFLKHLSKLNISLSTKLKVKEVNEFDRSMMISIGTEKPQFISFEVAKNLLVISA
jgi:alpha-beta hydrolase superfamily lysophospholipase